MNFLDRRADAIIELHNSEIFFRSYEARIILLAQLHLMIVLSRLLADFDS